MYKEKALNLNNIFSFWNDFQDEEKFLFYNPNEKEIIMGAKRLKTFKHNESFDGYKYIFSTKTFFDSVKDSIWNDFKSENIAFSYYLKIKDNKQTLYYQGIDRKFCDNTMDEEYYDYTLANTDYDDWKELFNISYDKILTKKINKVVLSREVIVDLSKRPRVECIIKRLIDNNSGNFIFAYSKGNKCFLGATPEILLEKKKNKIISHAVAGTLLKDKKNDSKNREEFLKDEKNSHEHDLVVSTIKKTLEKYGNNTYVSKRKLLEAKNLYHLHTELLTDSTDDIITWRDRLHPTPALGGTPRDIALEIIRKHEPHERGMYASPIGLIDESGNGVYVVGIRSGMIENDKLYGYAGCGIVKNSDCKKEYIETEGKLKTILECL